MTTQKLGKETSFANKAETNFLEWLGGNRQSEVNDINKKLALTPDRALTRSPLNFSAGSK